MLVYKGSPGAFKYKWTTLSIHIKVYKNGMFEDLFTTNVFKHCEEIKELLFEYSLLSFR